MERAPHNSTCRWDTSKSDLVGYLAECMNLGYDNFGKVGPPVCARYLDKIIDQFRNI